MKNSTPIHMVRAVFFYLASFGLVELAQANTGAFGQLRAPSGSCLIEQGHSRSDASQIANSIKNYISNPAIQKAQEYEKKARECDTASSTAQNGCKQACSAPLNSGTNNSAHCGAAIQPGAANQAGGQQQCATQAMSTGFDNFMKDCNPKRTTCSTTCQEAYKLLQETLQQASSVQCQKQPMSGADDPACTSTKQQAISQLQQLVQKEGNTTDRKAVNGKQDQCSNEFNNTMNQAAQSLAELLKALMDAMKNQAQNQSESDSQKEKTCADPEKAQTKECICKADPRAFADCPQGLAAVGSANTAGGLAGVNPDVTTTRLPNGLPAVKQNQEPNFGGLPGATAASSGGGGGMAAPAGGATAAAASAKPSEEKKKGLSADVLSGDGGGGGGGGMFFGGPPKSADDKMKAYMPGGTKDPNRLAGQGRSAGISGAGGRSNWDKVKVRYTEKRTSFILNEN